MSEPTVVSERQPPPKIVLEIGKRSVLKTVNLIEFNGRVLDLRPTDSIDDLLIQVRLGAVRAAEPNMITAAAGVDIKCQAQSEKERTIARISCTFAGRYFITDPELFQRLTDADAAAFAEVNGMFHLWPYLREYIQEAGQKMMIPPIMLPYLHTVLGRVRIPNETTAPPARQET